MADCIVYGVCVCLAFKLCAAVFSVMLAICAHKIERREREKKKTGKTKKH